VKCRNKQTKQYPTGEQLRVQQRGRGIDAATGYLLMDVLVDGDVPKFEGEDVITLAPFEEVYTQTQDGNLHGSGKTTLRFGQNYVVPVELVLVAFVVLL
jgi:hypothetical protein